MTQKVRLALYARNSDESQSPASIEDQMRRSMELVAKLGLEATTVLRFSDEDMSGYKKRTAYARPGFKSLLQAWDEGAFDVLAVDELSRLGRNARQQLEIIERLDETNVRLICADGIDSDVAGSRMALGFKGVMAQEESRSTSHRVKRGMMGQLMRGYMMAPPPFGYRSERQYGEGGRAIGTIWHIVDEEALIVREMYRMRSTGVAFGQIARWLNDTGVITSRGARFWRAASIKRVLDNTVYRGEVAWYEDVSNAATTTGWKPNAKERVKRIFERPQLRIVSDDLWYGAQGEKVSRSGYGGGRLAYSGIIHCGHCQNLLSSSSNGTSFACGSCGANRLTGDPAAPETVPSISVVGLNAIVRFALERVFDAERIAVLRGRLQERLSQGPLAALHALRKKRESSIRSTQHLLRLICKSDEPDALLDAEYVSKSEELRVIERQLKSLETAQSQSNRQDIIEQIKVDPSALAEKLLDGKLPVAHVRAVLTQLFPRFVFLGRESRYIARFEIDFAPGVAVAWLTETKPILDEFIRLRVKLIGSARRPVAWQVVEESATQSGRLCHEDEFEVHEHVAVGG